MRIQLIALDLDGTLLNSAKQVTPHTLEALQKAASKGVVLFRQQVGPLMEYRKI
jgi:hydroxymethylpyrimidine pyrophosphatase-like HAD family hydrolase